MKKYAYALAATLAAGIAQADEPAHAYVNVAAGATHISVDCTGATSCAKSDTGGKIVAGYSFGNGFGLEASYVRFGKAQAYDTGLSTTVKPAALMIGGIVSLPLSNEWGVNVRLGVGRVKTKYEAWVSAGRASGADTKTQYYGGLGLTYALSPSVKLELAVDQTRGELEGEKGMIRLLSLGATFAF